MIRSHGSSGLDRDRGQAENRVHLGKGGFSDCGREQSRMADSKSGLVGYMAVTPPVNGFRGRKTKVRPEFTSTRITVQWSHVCPVCLCSPLELRSWRWSSGQAEVSEAGDTKQSCPLRRQIKIHLVILMTAGGPLFAGRAMTVGLYDGSFFFEALGEEH
jgi:hypothetical protein